MNKILSPFRIVLSLTFLSLLSTGQNNMNFYDPSENFYRTQRRMNRFFRNLEREQEREKKETPQAKGQTTRNAGEEEELRGYQVYKRWEEFMAPRVYPSGDKSIVARSYQEFMNTQEGNPSGKVINGPDNTFSTTWQPIGPFGDPTGGNAGRINMVRFDPTNASGYWVCAPDGGLWSTANNGSSWNTNTNLLQVIGTTDVIFDPTNPQNMFLATGDGDAGDSYSYGVLKSTNGGNTWSATGLTFNVSQGRVIHKLLMNPQNKNTFFAATSVGLYKTNNGGTSFTVVAGGDIDDVEYKPGDTTTVYCCNTQFLQSTNGGTSFTAITNGMPASGSVQRLAIAVTPANASVVYVVAASASNSGFLGFYQSTNSGTSFITKASTPNLLGWASAGNDTGGQGWYTLSTAASPTNSNEIVVGGVNIWRSTNGGSNWSLFAHWTGTGAPYVHADIHDLDYRNGSTVLAGTDGGVFQTTNGGTSFAAINGNMNIAQIYKIGLSTNTYSMGITGHQDNGTNIYSGGWTQTMGGDGMACFIDRTNDLVMYGEQYNGSFNRTTDGGQNWTGITTGLTGNASWVAPWHQDPAVANTIYGGYSQIFKSTNQGTSWSQMGTIGGSGTIVEFAIAPSNNQVVYAIRGNALYKTSNGGASWAAITGTLPVGSAQLTWVAVKNTDPNMVFVTFSGYSAGNKIFKSTDGGTTWTNYSTGLPNLPTNCVTYWNGSNDGVYVGCDVGVYYRDASMASWVSYSSNLPNVAVRDLAIFYPLGKLRAATFGRSAWEIDLYNNGLMAPIANFTADKNYICPSMTVNYSDLSTFGPTSWSWVFPGGSPATSTVQNPAVVYNTPGTYSAALTASNVNGSSVMTKTMYIVVSSTTNVLPFVEGFQGAIFPPTNWQNYDAATDNLKWAWNTSVGKNSSSSMFYDNYTLNANGTRDEMRSPKFNFTGYANLKMYFDVAYARYDPTYSDSLAIRVSTDCGLTYTQLYLKGGTTLATAPDYTANIFVPTAAQWRTDTVNLNAYAGMSNVMVTFQNIGRYGQALYVDNINITGAVPGQPPTALFTHTNTPCTGQTISFIDQSTNIPNAWNWQFPGGSPASATVANPAVVYNTPGTYTVTLVSANQSGTSSPVTQTVTVGLSPTVTANNINICAGDAATLSASGASSYSWSNGATTATTIAFPITTTVYTVTGTTTGCKDIKTVTVTVDNTPNLMTSDTTICEGNAATLSASGANTYSWSTGATTSSIAVSPSVTTTYTVTGMNGACSLDAVVSVSVMVCSGIRENSLSGAYISITPNPSNGKFTVSTDLRDNFSLTVYNSLGQMINYFPQSKNKLNVDLSRYGKGIYYLQFSSGGNSRNVKVAVE
jgi:PKD repeat protein